MIWFGFVCLLLDLFSSYSCLFCCLLRGVCVATVGLRYMLVIWLPFVLIVCCFVNDCT